MLALLVALTGCSQSPTEAALRETLDAMQDAAQSRSASGVMAHIDPTFAGQAEASSATDLRRYLTGFFLTTQRVGITRPLTEIEIKGEFATVRSQFLVTGSQGFLPSEGRLIDVESAWRYSDGEWLLINASWR